MYTKEPEFSSGRCTKARSKNSSIDTTRGAEKSVSIPPKTNKGSQYWPPRQCTFPGSKQWV